jgi:hypothetical protein
VADRALPLEGHPATMTVRDSPGEVRAMAPSGALIEPAATAPARPEAPDQIDRPNPELETREARTRRARRARRDATTVMLERPVPTMIDVPVPGAPEGTSGLRRDLRLEVRGRRIPVGPSPMFAEALEMASATTASRVVPGPVVPDATPVPRTGQSDATRDLRIRGDRTPTSDAAPAPSGVPMATVESTVLAPADPEATPVPRPGHRVTVLASRAIPVTVDRVCHRVVGVPACDPVAAKNVPVATRVGAPIADLVN